MKLAYVRSMKGDANTGDRIISQDPGNIVSFGSSTRILTIRYRQLVCSIEAQIPNWDHNDGAIPRHCRNQQTYQADDCVCRMILLPDGKYFKKLMSNVVVSCLIVQC